MSADLLEQATRALREETRTPPDSLDRALERLERARRTHKRPWRSSHALAWALASTFVGVGAWANVTGRVSWFESEPRQEDTVPSEPPPAPRPRAVIEAPPVEAPAPELEPAPSEPVPVSPPARARVPAPAPPAPKALPIDEEPSAPKPAVVDPADALYRAAHAAHFGGAGGARVVEAWDRYLEAARPGHRWLLEARFNRAVALYRIGHHSVAAAALKPFAEGEYGGYRREEARRLLDAIAEQR